MIELKGLQGLSAWLVYNKVVFGLIFCRRFNVAANDQTSLLIALKQCETVAEFKEVTQALDTLMAKPVSYTMAECLQVFKAATDEQKEAMLLECLTFIGLSDDESLRLLALHKDENGIGISKANIKNFDAGETMDRMLKTMLSCSQLNCDFALMNAEDQKALEKYRVDVRNEANDILSKSPELETGNVLVMALKNIAARFSKEA